MKNLSALFLLWLPQLLSAQLPYQHKLFDSQVNYASILAQMEVLLQSSTDTQENGLQSNYYRWKYFWDNRVSYKTGVANSFYPSHEAMKLYWENKEDYCAASGSFQGNWKNLGPFNEITTRVSALENQPGELIQGNGRVDALWINPSNEDYILAGSISGGLWKTTDGGQNWSCLTDASGLPAMGVQAVDVDPLNNQRIWIATGSGYVMSSYGYGLGLCYSQDGGTSWQVDENFLNLTEPDGLPIVPELRFAPGTSTLFACVGNKIFRNLNGIPNSGWELVLEASNSVLIFDDIEFPPANSQIIFAGSTDGNGNGGGAQLWKSESGGVAGSWQQVTAIPNPLSNTVTGGDFQDNNIAPYQNAGSLTGNQEWHTENIAGDFNAVMLPAVGTVPNYFFYDLDAENRWFTCGAVKNFSFMYSLPAKCRLILKVSTDETLDVNDPNTADPVIWESHPAGTYPMNDVTETNAAQSFTYSCSPDEFYYGNFYFKVDLALDYVNSNGVPVTIDDILVTSSSADKIGVDIPDASRFYALVHYIWDDSKYLHQSENWGSSFTLNATLGNTCITSGTSNSCWGLLRPDFEVSSGGNNPVFYVGGNTVEKYVWNSSASQYDAFKISNYAGDQSHADIRKLLFYNNGTPDDPLTHVLFAGTDGGISKKELNATTFTDINGAGLAITQYYGFSGIEEDASMLIGGAQDNGITRLVDGVWEHTLFGDGYETAIDFFLNPGNNEHYVFAESSSGPPPNFHLSTNGGLSFGNGIKPANWSGAEAQVKPMKIIRRNNGTSRVYAGGHTDLYFVDDRTTLQGSDFTPLLLNNNLFVTQEGIPAIIAFDLHSETDENLYVAYSGTNGSKRLFVINIPVYLLNGGSSGWTDVTGTLPTTNFRITDVVSNPSDPDEVWVTFGNIDYPLGSGANRVFYSDDAGATWHDVSRGLTDLPVNCIIYQEGSDGIVYIGTDAGVYFWNHGSGEINWTNSENKWHCFSTGLPACIVTDLDINYCSGKLRAATWGRGIWESNLFPQTLITPRNQNSDTWNADRRENQSFRIPGGQTLTIANCEVTMAANTYIKVEPGGTLILDGATLTNPCGYMWSGIQVVGDPVLKQTPTSNQGLLVLKNGARIEHAYVGAMADEAGYSAPDYTFPNGSGNKGGGIIQVQFNQANPCHILNCRNGIGFGPYHSPPVNGTEPVNKSYIRGCMFENTGVLHLPYDNAYTNQHISMWNVHGIVLKGNTFSGPAGVKQAISKVKGIVSIDADYTVDDYCLSQNMPCSNAQHTQFNDLYRGIYATITDPGAAARLLKIANCSFNNVRRSVYLSGHQNADVIFNTILLNQTNNDTAYGIYTNGCTFYTIEENTISGPNPLPLLSFGIIINNSVGANNENDDNLVYKNWLNNLQYGTVSMRRNANSGNGGATPHGLEFRCNEYSNVNYAVAVFAPLPGTQYATIKHKQGDTNDPVGNKFEISTAQWSLWKSSIPTPTYYHHNVVNYDPANPSTNVTNFVLVNTNNTEVSCPSHFDQGGGEGQKVAGLSPEQIKAQIEGYELSADSLLTLIDAGNTATLISQANDATINSEQLKSALLAVGPLLSDTVLNASLTRSNPMKNSDAKEVIMTNSPVEDTVYAILEAEKPVVAENIAVVNAQEGVSDRSNLLAEAGNLFLKSYLALHSLRDYYEESDSVNGFYQYLMEQEKNQYAIAYAFQLGDLGNAQTMINQMEESDLKSYYQLAIDKKTSSQLLTNLTTEELNWIKSIAGEESVSGLLALNLLTLLDGGLYYEDFPMIDEAELVGQKVQQTSYIPTLQLMQASPNPAHGTISIQFSAEFESKGTQLLLTDVFGKEMQSRFLNDDYATVPISLVGLATGIYFLQLKHEGILLETEKIVVE